MTEAVELKRWRYNVKKPSCHEFALADAHADSRSGDVTFGAVVPLSNSATAFSRGSNNGLGDVAAAASSSESMFFCNDGTTCCKRRRMLTKSKPSQLPGPCNVSISNAAETQRKYANVVVPCRPSNGEAAA